MNDADNHPIDLGEAYSECGLYDQTCQALYQFEHLKGKIAPCQPS